MGQLRTLMMAGELVAAAIGPLAAQEPDTGPISIETVEVVGSHIRDLDPKGVSPVLLLDRSYIDQTGAITVGELLEQLPMNNAGSINDRDALSSSPGGTGISFRGLGPDAVLVLINGRPSASYPFPHITEFGSLTAFVDTNNIPLAAVERIEVLKDGASAIYGSQAMAGVINIVLRDSIRGTTIELRRGSADGSGAAENSFNLLSGLELPRFDFELMATHTSREQLAWSDRTISASANQEAVGGSDQRSTAAANFYNEFGVATRDAECADRNQFAPLPAYSVSTELGLCLFDANSQIVVPSIERSSLTLLAGSEITAGLKLSVEMGILSGKGESRREPAAWTDGVFPTGNPWNPTGSDLVTSYRFSEVGPRIDTLDVDNRRFVAALEGTLGNWSWELSALTNESTTRKRGEGYLSADRIVDALNGVDLDGNGLLEADEYLNLYSPVSNPNSLALTNSLKAPVARRSVSRLKSYVLKAVRNLRQMRAGNLFLALGFDRRIESIKDLSDPQTLIPLIDGWSDPETNKSGPAGVVGPDLRLFGMRVDLPLDQIDPYAYIEPWDVPTGLLAPSGFVAALGSQSQSGAFGELRVPILPELALQLALRFDAIEGFDKGLSPRVALRFGEARRVRTRASWSQGFRAPSPGELFRGPSTKLQASWDPKRCPQFIEPFVIPELGGGCVTTAFVTAIWGNPNLAAEQSESTSVGVEGDVFEQQRIGVDCWEVDVYDKIVTAQTAWMIRNEDNLPAGTILRYDPLPLDPPGYPGGIRQVNLLPFNIGRQEVKGCDLDVDTEFNGPADGVFKGQMLATHMASNQLSLAPGEPLEEFAGTYGYPRNRVNLNVTWSRNRWQAGLYARWTEGFEEATGEGEVASHAELDAQMRFAASRATSVTLGIENLLDEPPPFSASSVQGFPVDYYDMRGRFVYLQVRHTVGGRPDAAAYGD